MKMQLPIVSAAMTLFALAACEPVQEAPPLSSPTFDRALAILQTQASSPDPTIRANCIEALQVSHDPRATDIIEQGLHDKEWVVRFAAAMAAGKGKLSAVRPVLNTLVGHDPDGSVRVACIYALRQLGDSAHMSELAVALDSKEPSTRANAALVLGMLGDGSAIPLLQIHGDDPDVRVKSEITAALARLGDEASQQVIVAWAVEKFAEDQWNAMVVCDDLPPRIATSPLLLGLEDVPPGKLPADVDPEQVRELTIRRQLVAARSLAKMKYNVRRAAEVAIDNLKNPSPALRALAVLALGDMLSSTDAPKIDNMLDDADPKVRLAAAAAVINIYARAAQNQ